MAILNAATMGNILVKSALVDFSIQFALFVVAAALKTEKFYDLAGSGTFLYLAYKSLAWGEKYFTRQKIQTGLVIIWALRLGLYLFSRILKDGHDRRFNGVRDNPSRFFIYWTIQGVWIFITLLPTLMLNGKQNDESLTLRDYAGWGLWGAGFMLEAVADYQKSVFKSNPDNAGKFISSGLWSVSRHPNYLGEIMMWTGLFISASSVLHGAELVSVISPMFVAYLLINVSGIPILEKMGMKRWGKTEAYINYVKNTPVLIPYIY